MPVPDPWEAIVFVSAITLLMLMLFGMIWIFTGDVAALEDGENGNQTTVVAQVDDDIRVTEYAYDDDEEIFLVALENTGDSVVRVTLTEVVSSDRSGAGSFGIETVRLSGGEEVVVEVDVERVDGAAGVMITTQASIEAGSGTFLQDRETLDLFDGHATWNDVRVASISGGIAGVFWMILGAWSFVYRKHRKIRRPEL